MANTENEDLNVSVDGMSLRESTRKMVQDAKDDDQPFRDAAAEAEEE